MKPLGYLFVGFFGSGVVFAALGIIAKKCYDQRRANEDLVYQTEAEILEAPIAQIMPPETSSSIRNPAASKVQVSQICTQI